MAEEQRAKAPRDVVMDLMWNQLHRILTSKDATTQPTLMFEELEPIMEACYEAGQDSQAEFEEALRLRARIGATMPASGRVRFSTWWRTPPPTSAEMMAETQLAMAKRTAERINRWSYGCDVRLVLPTDGDEAGAVMWAECVGCGQSTQRYPFRQGGAPARAGRATALACERVGRLLHAGWVDVSVLMEWEQRHQEFVAKSIQAHREGYKKYHAEHSYVQLDGERGETDG